MTEKTQELETISVRVCRDCGGRYSTPGLSRMHKCQQGPGGNFKTVKELRAKQPTRIAYQPGYAPEPTDAEWVAASPSGYREVRDGVRYELRFEDGVGTVWGPVA